MAAPEQQLQALTGHIESLIGWFAAAPDAAVRQHAQELVQLLLQLYGAALERTMQVVGRDGAAIEALTADELVASLLVLHDLHPDQPPARIRRGLERIAALTGAEVALAECSGSTVRVQVTVGPRARKHAPAELRRLIEEAVQSAAPDVTHVIVDGLERIELPLVQLTAARTTRRGAT